MTNEIPFFAISNDELEANDYAEEFYICDKCEEKHPIKFAESEYKDPKFRLGFYKCNGKSYLYSLGDKQIC